MPQANPTEETLKDRVVGNYRLSERIGAGATAQVYRATHRALLTEHAVKVLRLRGAGMRRRAIQEGRVQARLRHPGIVAVTDVLIIDEHPALVGDFVPGPDLGRWLETGPPRALRLQVFEELVDALDFAHQLGVVHRDMKPENVIIDLSGPTPRPRITDFGLARLVREELRAVAGARGPTTQDGTILGTPAFMAPEQFQDASTVDARADIFALGCILYALLFDALPFPAHDLMAAAGAIQGGRYVRPLAREPQLAPALAEAVEGCLEVDAAERIPDCQALLQVLKNRHTPSRTQAPAPAPAPTTGLPTLTGPAAAPAHHSQTLVPENAPETEPPATFLPDPPDAPVAHRSRWPLALVPLLLLAALVFGLTRDPAPAAAPAVSTAPEPTPPPAATPPPEPEPAVTSVPEPKQAATAPRPSPRPSTGRTPAKPAPEPAPPPTAAPPDPAPRAPKPTPAPPEDPPSTGHVTVAGSTPIELRQGTRTLAPGTLAPGSYAIYARFDGGPPVHAGDLSLREGQRATISCVPEFQQCRSAP